MTCVKICCISSVEEAELAIRHGANALGLVSAMPSGPGTIDEDLIASIVATVPDGIDTFLLTSKTSASEIIAQQERCQTNTLQLCDHVSAETHAELRAALPHVQLVQVVHVRDENSVSEAIIAASSVDTLLLDSGNQSLEVKELGGTGKVHDWSLSERIVRESLVPVFLAGGLRPSNVAEAIRRVRPHGVDLCTGVRTENALNGEKLMSFMASVREGSEQ